MGSMRQRRSNGRKACSEPGRPLDEVGVPCGDEWGGTIFAADKSVHHTLGSSVIKGVPYGRRPGASGQTVHRREVLHHLDDVAPGGGRWRLLCWWGRQLLHRNGRLVVQRHLREAPHHVRVLGVGARGRRGVRGHCAGRRRDACSCAGDGSHVAHRPLRWRRTGSNCSATPTLHLRLCKLRRGHVRGLRSRTDDDVGHAGDRQRGGLLTGVVALVNEHLVMRRSPSGRPGGVAAVGDDSRRRRSSIGLLHEPVAALLLDAVSHVVASVGLS
mmetsp:Transcript_113815/g.302470  ORF Transcript_113815/g.302470 Transcript_113815/m.302470 type:complete len:271 (-) Transcript_113815:1141-1953(-)